MPGTNVNLSMYRNPSTGRLDPNYNPNGTALGNDLYWLIGQSNMIGRAAIRPGIDDVYTAISARVSQYGYNAQAVIAATNPLDHVNENAGQMGLWLEFVKTRVPLLFSSRNILLVPAAQGGTSFVANNWNPGNTLYNAALARLSAARSVSSGGDNNLKAVLWLQGESDADSGQPAADLYLTKIQAMYDAMVANASGMTSSTPFIVGSIKPDKPRAGTINTALQQFATNNAAVKYVDLTDLAWFDSDHYTNASLATAGQRYGAQL